MVKFFKSILFPFLTLIQFQGTGVRLTQNGSVFNQRQTLLLSSYNNLLHCDFMELSVI